ncbi:mCG145515, partial [Mus musculus]
FLSLSSKQALSCPQGRKARPWPVAIHSLSKKSRGGLSRDGRVGGNPTLLLPCAAHRSWESNQAWIQMRRCSSVPCRWKQGDLSSLVQLKLCAVRKFDWTQ